MGENFAEGHPWATVWEWNN